VPNTRFLNTAFAVWLFSATQFIHHATMATLWNNLIVAIVVFLFSLMPNQPTTTRQAGQRPLHA
jgi:hypothetical protein